MKLFATALTAEGGSTECFNIKSSPVQFTLVGGAINQMFPGCLFSKWNFTIAEEVGPF